MGCSQRVLIPEAALRRICRTACARSRNAISRQHHPNNSYCTSPSTPLPNRYHAAYYKVAGETFPLNIAETAGNNNRFFCFRLERELP